MFSFSLDGGGGWNSIESTMLPIYVKYIRYIALCEVNASVALCEVNASVAFCVLSNENVKVSPRSSALILIAFD